MIPSNGISPVAHYYEVPLPRGELELRLSTKRRLLPCVCELFSVYVKKIRMILFHVTFFWVLFFCPDVICWRSNSVVSAKNSETSFLKKPLLDKFCVCARKGKHLFDYKTPDLQVGILNKPLKYLLDV